MQGGGGLVHKMCHKILLEELIMTTEDWDEVPEHKCKSKVKNKTVPGLIPALVLGRPEFQSSAMLVNSQLVASCQLGF